jgi:hypothetical protein
MRNKFVKTFPAIEVRPVTTEDFGRVVQIGGSFGSVAKDIHGEVCIGMFRNFEFVFMPYSGEPVVTFDAPVAYMPDLLSHHGTRAAERNSLSLHFQGTDPLVVVQDPVPLDPNRHPGNPVLEKPRWRFLNVLTGETLPSDEVPRPTYRYWGQAIMEHGSSMTWLITINEKAYENAVRIQHVQGRR